VADDPTLIEALEVVRLRPEVDGGVGGEYVQAEVDDEAEL